MTSFRKAAERLPGRYALSLLALLAVFSSFSLEAGLRQASLVTGSPLPTPGGEAAEAHQRLAAADPQGPVAGPSRRTHPDSRSAEVHLLYEDRIVDYWLYPRRIYSASALEHRGEDVQRFVEKEGINWLYDGNELDTLDPSRLPAVPAAAPQRPCALSPAHPLRAGAGVLAALTHFLVLGICILKGVGADRLLGSRMERIAVSFLIGAGGTGLWTLTLFATGLGVRLPTVLLSLIAGLVAFLYGRRRSRETASAREGVGRERPPEPRLLGAGTRTRRQNRVALIAAATLLGVLVLRAVALPMSGYDDRYQWAHKAHIMLHEDGIRSSAFRDPQSLQAHPKYPLLIPSIEAVVFLYAGGFDDQYATVLFPLFLGALLPIFYRGLESLRGPQGAGPLTLALAVVPFYWSYGSRFDSAAAFTGYPDLPLSVFLAAAIIYLLRGRASASPSFYSLSALLLLFTALTKAEGRLHAVIFLLAAAGFLLWTSGTGARARIVRESAAFVGAALLIAIHELLVVRPTQTGIVFDDYSALLTWDRLVANSGRIPSIAAMLATDIFLSPRFGFFGLLLAGATILWWRRASAEASMPLVYVVFAALLFGVPFVLLPEPLWRSVYFWSAGRLLVQVLPVGFLALCLQALPRDGRALPTVAPAPQGG